MQEIEMCTDLIWNTSEHVKTLWPNIWTCDSQPQNSRFIC